MISFSFSRNYKFLQIALNAHAKIFVELDKQMDAYKPLAPEVVKQKKTEEFLKLRQYSPMSNEDLTKFVDSQVDAYIESGWDYTDAFHRQYAAEMVAIVMLSHALAEALINAILAVGLASKGKSDLFLLLEQSNIKDKWITGPTSFLANYMFPKLGKLNETLIALCRLRNSYVHSKITLRDQDDNVVLKGSHNTGLVMDKKSRNQIHNFLSLPYSLHQHFLSQLDEDKNLNLCFRDMLA